MSIFTEKRLSQGHREGKEPHLCMLRGLKDDRHGMSFVKKGKEMM